MVTVPLAVAGMLVGALGLGMGQPAWGDGFWETGAAREFRGTLTLERLLGWILWPLAWAMGVPASEAYAAGQLLGVKIVVSEYVSYLQMGAMIQADPAALSQHTRLIMTYAMCGFANFASLGIMLGGLAQLAPDRREDIVALGARTLISGNLATMLTGAVVGLIHFF